jgi:hypothetical protein
MIKPAHRVTAQTKSMVIAAVTAVLAVGSVGVPTIAHAMMAPQPVDHSTTATRRYVASIHELNHTGVTGTATFTTSSNEMTVTVNASGLEPGVHPMHIHGKNQAEAECPTMAQDTNGDGYLSVIEGAPSYGLIKLNLTSPQTAFGTPPTPALFYPFAGTPNNANFPVVGSNGKLHYSQTFTFDNSAEAQAAWTSLTPLGDQAIVIHGATAPKSVDASAFAALGSAYPTGTDLTARTYDALLPAGCGMIDQASTTAGGTSNGSAPITGLDSIQLHVITELTKASANAADASVFNNRISQLSANFSAAVNAAVGTYQTDVAHGLSHDEARNRLVNAFAGAKDQELNGLTDSRNQLIDQMNHAGNVSNRDAFLSGFNTAVDQYRAKVEVIKNQL